MPLLVNLRHLANQNLSVKGELPVADLDLEISDQMIHLESPLQHDFEVQKLDQSLLLHGRLSLVLDCQCVRCLKPFRHPVILADWTCYVPLQGDESAPVSNDCVDLTPYIREDILLELPQHPLCNPKCRGLEKAESGEPIEPGVDQKQAVSSAWTELDKLKL